jgi:hypothetical protein
MTLELEIDRRGYRDDCNVHGEAQPEVIPEEERVEYDDQGHHHEDPEDDRRCSPHDAFLPWRRATSSQPCDRSRSAPGPTSGRKITLSLSPR